LNSQNEDDKSLGKSIESSRRKSSDAEPTYLSQQFRSPRRPHLRISLRLDTLKFKAIEVGNLLTQPNRTETI